MPSLLAAFRSGAGVPYGSYGDDGIAAQAALNRPAFVNQLVAEWIPQIPDVAARLADTALTTRVADVGCGLGWAAIELAKAYPHLNVDGYDTDEESISKARANAAEAGVSDRVTFDVVDASGGYGYGRYDLVLFFECVHDMAHPVAAMQTARTAVTEGGTVIVMDERVGEELTVGDPTETFFATASVLWCLPQGRVEPDSEAVGTVMRPDRFRSIVRDAGWSDIDVLPIDHPFWRFYRLVP
jgi:2-polyprenyl-3-methyl-5-hydroxy-6-metoxy-1,4-benzoquinol methylase